MADSATTPIRLLLIEDSEIDATFVTRLQTSNPELPFEVRKNAVIGLARNKGGEQALLALAESKRLAADTRLLAGGLLARSRDEAVRRRAGELLPQPQLKDQSPLAPIDEWIEWVIQTAAGRAARRFSNQSQITRRGLVIAPARPRMSAETIMSPVSS